MGEAFERATGSRPNMIFECVGVPGVIPQCISLAPRNGKIVVAGVCMQPDTIFPAAASVKGLCLQFVTYYRRGDFALTLDMLAAERIDPQPMVTERIELDALPAAFEALRPFSEGATCLRDVSAEVLLRHGPGLEPELARRARHVVEEVERTFRARAALLTGDLATFGACMAESHVSLREQYEVSVPELDCLVETALEHECVLGSRLTGAGFGGCVVILARDGAREDLAEHIRAGFQARFKRPATIEFFSGDRGPREISAAISA